MHPGTLMITEWKQADKLQAMSRKLVTKMISDIF